MEAQNLVIGDRNCSIVGTGEEGPVAIICNNSGSGDGAERLDYAVSLCKLVGERSGQGFSLLSFEVGSWNDDLSPWRYGHDFAGDAGATLAWVIGEAIPYLKERGRSRFLAAGYSLAGLFSLWCARKTDAFEGAASCSGSLWFPGWPEFSDGNPIMRAGSAVYLSLGGKEALAKDPLMATILDRTREESKRLRRDSSVRKTTLEMNAGGHFTKPLDRLAKGIAYLLKP